MIDAITAPTGWQTLVEAKAERVEWATAKSLKQRIRERFGHGGIHGGQMPPQMLAAATFFAREGRHPLQGELYEEMNGDQLGSMDVTGFQVTSNVLCSMSAQGLGSSAQQLAPSLHFAAWPTVPP